MEHTELLKVIEMAASVGSGVGIGAGVWGVLVRKRLGEVLDTTKLVRETVLPAIAAHTDAILELRTLSDRDHDLLLELLGEHKAMTKGTDPHKAVCGAVPVIETP